MAFAIRANAEMIREHQSSPNLCGISWDQRAVVAQDDNGRPIGIITFSKINWTQCFSIALGFVVPLMRRRGIYEAMWQELVSGRKMTAFRLSAAQYVAGNNTPMLALAKKLVALNSQLFQNSRFRRKHNNRSARGLRATIMAMLLATRIFGQAQASVIADYMTRESDLDPCAHSWMGESLLGVAGTMRFRFHRELGPGCISVARQIEWLAEDVAKVLSGLPQKI